MYLGFKAWPMVHPLCHTCFISKSRSLILRHSNHFRIIMTTPEMNEWIAAWINSLIHDYSLMGLVQVNIYSTIHDRSNSANIVRSKTKIRKIRVREIHAVCGITDCMVCFHIIQSLVIVLFLHWVEHAPLQIQLHSKHASIGSDGVPRMVVNLI